MRSPVPSASEAELAQPNEKRKHSRFGVDNGAVVSILGSNDSVRGEIADLSQEGFRLTVPLPFPVGEILRTEVGGEVFVAVVRHSRKTKDGYSVGTEMMHSIKRAHLDALVDEWGVAL